MKTKSRQSGISMTETVVVISTVVLLAVFGTPAVNSLLKSFESTGGTEAMISAAFASARAIAAKEQRYVGVRFQKAYDFRGPLQAPQYMIFIVHDPAPSPYGTDLANGFRAIEGIKPIKLPDTVGVMDLAIAPSNGRDTSYPERSAAERLDDPSLNDGYKDSLFNPNNNKGLTDTTTFSIIFSPSGKLVIHGIWVRNKNGKTESTQTLTLSRDDIFNTRSRVTDPFNPFGMFVQDDYFGSTNPDIGLGPEASRSNFIIYEQQKFKEAYKNGKAYSGYLKDLKMIYINPYTGTIIVR